MKETLAYYKETENKYRWDAWYQDQRFELYIPKWRVPTPIPTSITVRIYTESEFGSQIRSITPAEVSSNPVLAATPIAARIVFNHKHTETVRYDPKDASNESEIGSPYIPQKMLGDPFPPSLVITVNWN
jgi:hypothetical protein